jgi:GTP-binding protein YchF
MKVGIVGLPNVGKSSLFNLLTQAHAQVASFPFTTIDRNVGMVTIADRRLEQIVQITRSPKVRGAAIEFVDIAGLIKGAAHGEGLGNQFLAHIRDVDLIIHLVRGFSDADIPHAEADLVPDRDYDIVRTELLLSDLAIVERRIDKVKKKAECREEYEMLNAMRDALSRGEVPHQSVPDVPLVSTKKEIIVLNVDERGAFESTVDAYRLSVKLEEALLEFSEDERKELRREVAVAPDGLTGLLTLCMKELYIILFYTIKGEEARAWPIRDGTKVIDAAGMIHSDMKEGFIKAEVLGYEEFIRTGGFTQAQHAGVTRIEGKEYVVKDGDIILVKFRAP